MHLNVTCIDEFYDISHYLVKVVYKRSQVIANIYVLIFEALYLEFFGSFYTLKYENKLLVLP